MDSCVKERCPNAERVLDGFHIVSWMTDALDKVRRRLWNDARRNGDEQAAKRMRGVKYAVLKNPDDLTGKQNAALDGVRNTDPKGPALPRVAAQGTPAHPAQTPLDQARGKLDHWIFWASRSRIPEIVELSQKIRRRCPDILRTIELGWPNARLEAFNNRIKVTIRMAFGFHHVDDLISLVMLRCGGR
ncbi:transposase [Bifidobacterium leontopitheci]|uniref:transposase n=1 Tax=Bifidobacterium leontopitheci TaxID=2650774 RepID=UPI0022209BFF